MYYLECTIYHLKIAILFQDEFVTLATILRVYCKVQSFFTMASSK